MLTELLKQVKKQPINLPDLRGLLNSFIIRKTSLKTQTLLYDKGKQPLTFHDLNATVNDIELSPRPNQKRAVLQSKRLLYYH